MRRYNPKHSLSLTLLAGLLLTLIVGMTISSVQPVTAQRPQRTPPAGGGGAGSMPTVDLSGVQITLPASDDLMATANALAAGDDLMATANAMLDSMGDVDMDTLMVTANAMLTAMPTFTGGLSSDDLTEWLESLSASSLSFDPDTGAIVVTVTIDEAMVDTVIAAALTEAGMGAASVSVDFVDGLIVMSAEDVSLSSSLTGDLSMSVALTAVNGEIVVMLVEASLNGKPLPPAALAELTALLEAGFNDSLQTPTGLDYSVDAVVVTDEAVLFVVLLTLSLE